MIKSVRYLSLTFLVFIVLFSSLAISAKAFSLDLHPVRFLQKTVDIISGRVSDLVYYLIMQKKYIFDGFADPNNYGSLEIPENLGKILNTNTSVNTTSSKAIAIATSSFNTVRKTVPNYDLPELNEKTTVIDSISSWNSITEPTNDDSEDSEILKYTNIERRNNSLSSLTANSILNNIAALRVDDLFANQYFEHESPDGKTASDLAKNLGYSYLLIGENLARGNFDDEQSIVTAWMDSPGHRANILNGKYQELGVAVKEGIFDGQSVVIAVQIFGLPLGTCPKPNQELKALIDDSTISIKKMEGEALSMFNNLNTIKNNSGVDSAYYYQKVQEYNYFIKKINDAVSALKSVTDYYNTEVSRYNSCIKI